MNDLTVIRFAGRCFSSEDVALMCQAARDYASLGITEIARTVCEWLDWKRPNGRLKNHGREAGILLGRTGTSGPIDATVVLVAAQGDRLLTSDTRDFKRLASAARKRVAIIPC